MTLLSPTAGPILVIGVPGMLGTALVKTLAPTRDVVAAPIESLDITDPAQIRDRLDEIRPACVINAAAMTDVDDCERDPAAARRVNADAPRLLAEACESRGLELIHISTDYVFDGAKGEPYTESDAVNPISAYGETKLRGEEAVQRVCARHKILRVSMLYGIHRGNFADFVAICIETGKPVKALTDNAGSPTHCADLARQVTALIGHPATGIFHSAGLGGCSRLVFAERIRELWPAPDLIIEPATQADFPQMLATRPADTRLECERLRQLDLLRLTPWENAVGDYLEARRAQCS